MDCGFSIFPLNRRLWNSSDWTEIMSNRHKIFANNIIEYIILCYSINHPARKHQAMPSVLRFSQKSSNVYQSLTWTGLPCYILDNFTGQPHPLPPIAPGEIVQNRKWWSLWPNLDLDIPFCFFALGQIHCYFIQYKLHRNLKWQFHLLRSSIAKALMIPITLCLSFAISF